MRVAFSSAGGGGESSPRLVIREVAPGGWAAEKHGLERQGLVCVAQINGRPVLDLVGTERHDHHAMLRSLLPLLSRRPITLGLEILSSTES